LPSVKEVALQVAALDASGHRIALRDGTREVASDVRASLPPAPGFAASAGAPVSATEVLAQLGTAAGSPPDFPELGQDLFALLERGSVGAAWEQRWAAHARSAAAAREGLRTVLAVGASARCVRSCRACPGGRPRP
jgi:hypothetical protein